MAVRQHDRRVAVFLPSLAGGGAERIALTLLAGLVGRGVPADLVVAGSGGALRAEVPQGVRLVDLGKTRPLRAVPALIRYLRRERPSALLSTVLNANVAASIAVRMSGAGIRHVVREASTLSAELARSSPLNRLLMRVIARRLYPRADAVVAVSAGVADDLERTLGLDRRAIQVIHNPVLSESLLKRARQHRARAWSGEGILPVIVGAGRLSREKDFGTLIEAFARVRQSIPSRLVILGEGEERNALQDLARRHGLENDISMPGFVTDPYPIYAGSTVFVLPSRWEGSPGALVEALACGAPVVATDCPSGPREILADGAYGQLVPVGDAEAMATAILDVLSGAFVAQNPARHLALFDADKNVDSYLELLIGKGEK